MNKLQIDANVCSVPIWVQMPDLKFWGPAGLSKVAGLVGYPIMADKGIAEKTKTVYFYFYFLISNQEIH